MSKYGKPKLTAAVLRRNVEYRLEKCKAAGRLFLPIEKSFNTLLLDAGEDIAKLKVVVMLANLLSAAAAYHLNWSKEYGQALLKLVVKLVEKTIVLGLTNEELLQDLKVIVKTELNLQDGEVKEEIIKDIEGYLALELKFEKKSKTEEEWPVILQNVYKKSDYGEEIIGENSSRNRSWEVYEGELKGTFWDLVTRSFCTGSNYGDMYQLYGQEIEQRYNDFLDLPTITHVTFGFFKAWLLRQFLRIVNEVLFYKNSTTSRLSFLLSSNKATAVTCLLGGKNIEEHFKQDVRTNAFNIWRNHLVADLYHGFVGKFNENLVRETSLFAISTDNLGLIPCYNDLIKEIRDAASEISDFKVETFDAQMVSAFSKYNGWLQQYVDGEYSTVALEESLGEVYSAVTLAQNNHDKKGAKRILLGREGCSLTAVSDIEKVTLPSKVYVTTIFLAPDGSYTAVHPGGRVSGKVKVTDAIANLKEKTTVSGGVGSHYPEGEEKKGLLQLLEQDESFKKNVADKYVTKPSFHDSRMRGILKKEGSFRGLNMVNELSKLRIDCGGETSRCLELSRQHSRSEDKHLPKRKKREEVNVVKQLVAPPPVPTQSSRKSEVSNTRVEEEIREQLTLEQLKEWAQDKQFCRNRSGFYKSDEVPLEDKVAFAFLSGNPLEGYRLRCRGSHEFRFGSEKVDPRKGLSNDAVQKLLDTNNEKIVKGLLRQCKVKDELRCIKKKDADLKGLLKNQTVMRRIVTAHCKSECPVNSDVLKILMQSRPFIDKVNKMSKVLTNSNKRILFFKRLFLVAERFKLEGKLRPLLLNKKYGKFLYNNLSSFSGKELQSTRAAILFYTGNTREYGRLVGTGHRRLFHASLTKCFFFKQKHGEDFDESLRRYEEKPELSSVRVKGSLTEAKPKKQRSPSPPRNANERPEMGEENPGDCRIT